jgi:hypothetical protein
MGSPPCPRGSKRSSYPPAAPWSRPEGAAEDQAISTGGEDHHETFRRDGGPRADARLLFDGDEAARKLSRFWVLLVLAGPVVAIAISLVPPLAVVGLTLESGAADESRPATPTCMSPSSSCPPSVSRSNPEPQRAACAIGAAADRQAVGTLGLNAA